MTYLRKKRRDELERRLAAIEREVRLLRRRLKRLPELPDMACVMWERLPEICVRPRHRLTPGLRSWRRWLVDTLYRLTPSAPSAPPDCSAVTARGHLHLLQSTARGITGTP